MTTQMTSSWFGKWIGWLIFTSANRLGLAVTSSSPLQYLKNMRLHKARMLMVHEGANAGTAALRVGYESASQFSREFKRLFGDAPAAVANQLRKSLTGLA